MIKEKQMADLAYAAGRGIANDTDTDYYHHMRYVIGDLSRLVVIDEINEHADLVCINDVSFDPMRASLEAVDMAWRLSCQSLGCFDD